MYILWPSVHRLFRKNTYLTKLDARFHGPCESWPGMAAEVHHAALQSALDVET